MERQIGFVMLFRQINRYPFRKLITVFALTALFLNGGCAVFTSDEGRETRTVGTVWDDQMIESKGRVKIKKAHSDLKNAHIDIVAYNGVVLLVGQVPSEETRQIAAETLQQMPKVKKLYNELQIAGPTSVFSRMNDGWLTTKIKSKMFASKEVEAGRIKVLTENGVTYLMGMVTKEEADSAVELARRVYGVQKVVKAFEIIELKDLPKMERASEKQPENNERNKQEEEELI